MAQAVNTIIHFDRVRTSARRRRTRSSIKRTGDSHAGDDDIRIAGASQGLIGGVDVEWCKSSKLQVLGIHGPIGRTVPYQQHNRLVWGYVSSHEAPKSSGVHQACRNDALPPMAAAGITAATLSVAIKQLEQDGRSGDMADGSWVLRGWNAPARVQRRRTAQD
jgi:hypothetical protein